MSPQVISVNVLENYLLELEFSNGEKGHFSVLPYLQYPVYQVLKNYDVFKRAKVTMGFISWDGEIDMSPDNLYLESKMIA
ncbi:MAG: DUF2442 domain-containing protein [Taibaiella sp.]|nr:DUF2442 domain-containing protein [Taibaiella sp.]